MKSVIYGIVNVEACYLAAIKMSRSRGYPILWIRIKECNFGSTIDRGRHFRPVCVIGVHIAGNLDNYSLSADPFNKDRRINLLRKGFSFADWVSLQVCLFNCRREFGFRFSNEIYFRFCNVTAISDFVM